MKLLVSTPLRVYLVDSQDQSVAVVAEGQHEYYGVTWTHDGQQLCLSHTGQDTFCLWTTDDFMDSEKGWLTVGGRPTAVCLSCPHQILCANGHVIAVNTGRNCLTLFRTDDLFYRNHWPEPARWDRRSRYVPEGGHYNSVYLKGNLLYVLAHNHDRGSYILVLSWPDLQLVKRIECLTDHSHNLWQAESGELIVCDSLRARLVNVQSGETLWQSEDHTSFARGLAGCGNYLYIGRSTKSIAAKRGYTDAGVWIIDRTTWKQVDFIPIPKGGSVQEVRVVDGVDFCHHGRPLLRIPAPDERATEEYRACARDSAREVELAHKAAAPRVAAQLPFEINFAELHSASLPPTWVLHQGDLLVNHQRLELVDNEVSVCTLHALETADVVLTTEADISAHELAYAGLVARYLGPADCNMYWAGFVRQGQAITVDIWRNVAGVWSLLASQAVSSGVGRLRFEVRGSSLALYVNDQLTTTVQDQQLPKPGSVGLRGIAGRFGHFAAKAEGPVARVIHHRLEVVTPGQVSVASPLEAEHHAKPGPPGAGFGVEKPLRIGVWCEYGKTLTPTEGIGVFTHSLVTGLLEQEKPVELVLMTRHGEQHAVAGLKKKAPERVHVLPEPGWSPSVRDHLMHLLYQWIRVSEPARQWLQRRRTAAQQGWGIVRGCLKQWLIRIAGPALYGNFPALAATLLLAPIVVLVAWVGLAVRWLGGAAIKIALFPLGAFDYAIRRLYANPKLAALPSIHQLARAARCDVWVIPYVGHEYPLDMPSVVFIHDLVVHHFPELFPAHFVKRLMEVAPQRAAEATLCACMSNFIKESDLLGVLQLPSEKVRMIHTAAPRDFPSLPELQAERLRPPQLQRPFLFYPASLFMHKNHRLILEAMRVLRDEFGEERFDLVCTGSQKDELPRELELLAVKLGLRQRVHVLGRVDRETLAALYIESFATIVPSLYEQASFPVYEALYLGSPVACSNIAPLREQCEAMGDAMLYFDPHDPVALARTILKIRDEREVVQQRQRFAGQQLWARTWTDVARDWLVVFEEAARLGREQAAASTPLEAAVLQAA